MNNIEKEMQESLYKGLIDRSSNHHGNFMPKLLTNGVNENVLSTILNELYKCKSFDISVAFITESGLASLKTCLYDLNKKGVKGRLITSNYLGFNTPKMYKELLKISNLDVRLTDKAGFHAKGYLFEHDAYYSLVVGSSNLTSNALKINYEHNILLSTHKNGDLIYHIKNEFENLWQESLILDEDWIENYQKEFKIQNYKKIINIDTDQSQKNQKLINSFQIVPNLMQEEALFSLKEMRNKGEKTALIISATGTGKTMMSALDVRNYDPEKFLFVVHNEGILKRAKEEFKKVLSNHDDSEFGLFTGQHKEIDAKYLFATIQTISKKDNYELFSENEFDYIVFDEAHRTAAKSYQQVFSYFKPKFMLGMTATPERTDKGNIFEIFNYNIAYEIRLPKALESDILCPFHYFGVTDYIHNGIETDDNAQLKDLATDERINHVINKIEYYGYSGNQLRGLIFVSRTEEAIEIAKKLSDRGYISTSLIGADSQSKRDKVISELKNGLINYIVTVDLFNEGIDIPEVNQIIMLRGTESSIIFTQQLGRGLRKNDSKEYVTVIDFIGNYKNNYLIPVALSDDHSQNKDNYRKFLSDPNILSGVSTINFEEIAKKKIYDSLEEVKMNSIKIIKKAFEDLNERIGRIPFLIDFIEQNSIDPSVLLSQFKNYNEFLTKYNYIEQQFTNEETKILTFLSREILPGLKRADIIVLEQLISCQNKIDSDELFQKIRAIYPSISEEDYETTKRLLDYSFFGKLEKDVYGSPLIYVEENKIIKHQILETLLSKDIFNKYTKKDILKLKNYHKNVTSVLFGYLDLGDFLPIFVTYHKANDISETTKYEDQFLSQSIFKWYTKSNRKKTSSEVQKLLNFGNEPFDIPLFVKKHDNEGSDFYYLGNLKPNISTIKQETKEGLPIVTLEFTLDTPVRDDIYRYITEN